MQKNEYYKRTLIFKNKTNGSPEECPVLLKDINNEHVVLFEITCS